MSLIKGKASSIYALIIDTLFVGYIFFQSGVFYPRKQDVSRFKFLVPWFFLLNFNQNLILSLVFCCYWPTLSRNNIIILVHSLSCVFCCQCIILPALCRSGVSAALQPCTRTSEDAFEAMKFRCLPVFNLPFTSTRVLSLLVVFFFTSLIVWLLLFLDTTFAIFDHSTKYLYKVLVIPYLNLIIQFVLVRFHKFHIAYFYLWSFRLEEEPNSEKILILFTKKFHKNPPGVPAYSWIQTLLWVAFFLLLTISSSRLRPGFTRAF